ncbi:DUF3566 domain-containing protein [Bifidobacterium sp. 82T24]|uniref:DUF3566 domain-containing protein n=1 Tax=Bifidobacterium pluvialisilvae TaxID=2834436 RepID=UPI001C55C7BC|nr:DUF3566 domain-containing protein [Bifidobacterium pluvialisilvae]MBW3088679.1 DUF3566 domain-containing protein [Bifidobacterium pluvialisilvae]
MSEQSKPQPREARTSRSAASNQLISEENLKQRDEAVPASYKPNNGRGGKQPGERKSSIPRARRMKLSLTKIDPWSVTKVSFLLAIALGIIQVVAMAAVWALLNSIGLFDNITQIVSTTGLDSSGLDVAGFLSLSKVLSVTTIFSIFEVVLITVLATIGAFIYNLVSALVGGIHLTLGDD